jgi:chemotaxis protein CheD
MEHLINDIIRHGGQRSNLEFKLFGGGKIMQAMMDVGRKNIEFVLAYLDTEGFRAVAEDLGDVYPRKVNYFPKTGRVRVKKLRTMHNDTIIRRESKYMDQLSTEPIQGEVELF